MYTSSKTQRGPIAPRERLVVDEDDVDVEEEIQETENIEEEEEMIS